MRSQFMLARHAIPFALAITFFNPAKLVRAELPVGDSIANAPASGQAVEELRAFLEREESDRSQLAMQTFAQAPLTKDDSEAAKMLLWDSHVARIRKERKAEMEARRITLGKFEMPFDYKVFGDKPDRGRSLFISMHGGGGTPKRVNDRQWENQKTLYTPAEGVYLAPRAPTNAWNLWHQGHVDQMFDRLIENLIVFEDVDPERVYLTGYSAGGDDVYQLAPRMADRWAAAAMMAGHPNETSPLGLRNLPFTIHVGENDSGYNRNKVAQSWKEQLADLRGRDPDGYPHEVQIHAGKGHWMERQDAVAIGWMAKFRRKTQPERVVWKQDDVQHKRFYWLAVTESPERDRAEVVADRDEQTFTLRSDDIPRVRLRLNDTMVDLDLPISITWNGIHVFDGTATRSIGTLAKTLAERGDPQSIYSAEITVGRGAATGGE